ncbi:MAG: SAM-dependent methyltransferase [Xanthobacteraceae bacterium]|nr:SAM-dependent methyltransferase [Xanthobacteraceae bacterium]
MAEAYSPMESEIRRLIGIAGPMPIADYMRLCLTHPQYGYYLTQDSIGAAGDFITAPEISQMFGELIGLWIAAVWQEMGAPENVRVVELGPGRGTMMIDALRAAKVAKDFYAAIVLHLVEISPKLRQLQQVRFESHDVPIFWHASLAEVPAGPLIVVANEFIDALPIHQAIKQADGWHERLIDIGPDGNLAFCTAADALPHFDATLPRDLRQSPEGSIYEWRADTVAFEIARCVRSDGAALIIDYGHARAGLGETLQAVAGHTFADPLLAPGEADLTAHVDFAALALSADIIGARSHGPVSQRDFLTRLGIDKRAAALKASAPERTAEIDSALYRLTGSGPEQMGELFKVLAIADPKFGPLPGFATKRR